MPDFIDTYEKLRNWWNESTNKNLRKILNYSIKYIGAMDYYSNTKYEWQDMLDKFIKEFTGEKDLEMITDCNSKNFKMSFDLIKNIVFKDDENKIEKFYKIFE